MKKLKIKEITSRQDFEDFIKGGNSVVKFGADWCHPCTVLHDNILDLDEERVGHINFGEIDCDSPDLDYVIDELNIKNLPTMIFYKEGKEVQRTCGVRAGWEWYDLIKVFNA